jgi:RNA recognition motif-containing protein
MQNNRLFVGNLSYDWTTDELETALHELFSAYGKVEAIHLPKHMDSGRHKGIAFVTMDTPENASAAKEDLQDKPFGPDGDDGPQARPLHIDFARPREDRPSRPRR